MVGCGVFFGTMVLPDIGANSNATFFLAWKWCAAATGLAFVVKAVCTRSLFAEARDGRLDIQRHGVLFSSKVRYLEGEVESILVSDRVWGGEFAVIVRSKFGEEADAYRSPRRLKCEQCAESLRRVLSGEQIK